MARKLNIRPTTGVYATYKNIRYDPWTAIAEFVDNSTQSYYDNIKKLEAIKYWKGLDVEVLYENDPDEGQILVIRDNAYGMNYQDFQRAIVLDSPPKKATRSEFGMGLKTAACWFGTMWSVESTELGSGITYRATIDVDALHKYKNEEIEVEEIECSKRDHGTVIRIWKLNRKIVGKQVKKTKDQLRGMYRTDLRTGRIRIFYNDESLQYEDPEILCEELPDGTTKEWKQDVDFVVHHESGDYPVSGYIAIRKEGSTSAAGFTLIRRGRVIIGGYENCYRPEEVFEKTNSFIYQRLFGELNMDEWPVTQTKDGFDWYNGLEDCFIDCLLKESAEYRRKAKEYRVRRKIDPAEEMKGVAETFASAGIIDSPSVEVTPPETIKLAHQLHSDGIEERKSFNNESVGVVLSGSSGQTIRFMHGGREYTFNFILDADNRDASWLSISPKDDEYLISLNIAHPFFEPYTDEPNFLEIIERFAFALALAEIESRDSSIDKRIEPSVIRKKMNDSLKAVANAEVHYGN